MTNFFSPVLDASVLLRKRGILSEVPLYRRNDTKHLHAKMGSSFVRLNEHGDTSADRIAWLAISENVRYCAEKGAIVEVTKLAAVA